MNKEEQIQKVLDRPIYMEYLASPEVVAGINERAKKAMEFEVMEFSKCLGCGHDLYFGPRTAKTFRKNDSSSYGHIWRHVDTEHHKCGVGIPQATPTRRTIPQ